MNRVAHDREGLLVAARDPTASAAAIEALLADGRRRRRMAQAAALTAARFDRGAAALRLAALFETVGDPA